MSGNSSRNGGSTRISRSRWRYSREHQTSDRISQLPGSLIVEILSLMPTKYAVRTCTLSKRWRFLWTFIHSFIFSPNDVLPYKDEKFVRFVDYVLASSVSYKIKSLEIRSNYLCRYEAEFSRWLSFAVERKVEHVKFLSMFDKVCTLPPQPFCTCSTLITLALHVCYFADNVVIAWNSLKSIKLEFMVLSDDNIVNLLSGCPALETLKLSFVHGFSCLKIKSSRLKRLEFTEWDGSMENDPYLEIIAPYLQHLKISGHLYNLRCRLVDVSSLVSANLTFNIECFKDIQAGLSVEYDDNKESCRDYHKEFRTLVQDNLQKMSCATELTIGSWFIEVLCMLQSEGVKNPELKCKYLTLKLGSFNMYGVAGLLQASPYVETLNLDMEPYNYYSVCYSELGHLAEGENIDLDCWISRFEFPNLKSVKIIIPYVICLKDHLGWNKLFKLSEILLKNAKVLEKFVIISKEKCSSCSKNCGSQYLFQLAEKFLGCVRSSTNSVIIILQ